MSKLSESRVTWFGRWFLNNKSVTILLISLLFFLNIFVFTKIANLFAPVATFLTVIMLPVILSALLYYLLNPCVDWLEKKKLSRTMAISLVFVILLALLIWGGMVLVPAIEEQFRTFSQNFPDYMVTVEERLISLLDQEQLSLYGIDLRESISQVLTKASQYLETFSRSAVGWAGGFASALARITIAILIAPFILFYLLRDGHRLNDYLVTFLPPRVRLQTHRVLSQINRQLAGYVQGQVIVAFVVALLFSIMFSLVGLRYGVTLGILAGFLNLIPYLGSFLAMVPVFILAFVTGPSMVIKCIIIFIIEQTIEGRLVTPLVLGSKLHIHPITILFVLLTAGSLLGVWGVFLAIPVYASVKVVLTELFHWYKSASGLYQEDTGDKEVFNE